MNLKKNLMVTPCPLPKLATVKLFFRKSIQSNQGRICLAEGKTYNLVPVNRYLELEQRQRNGDMSMCICNFNVKIISKPRYL